MQESHGSNPLKSSMQPAMPLVFTSQRLNRPQFACGAQDPNALADSLMRRHSLVDYELSHTSYGLSRRRHTIVVSSNSPLTCSWKSPLGTGTPTKMAHTHLCWHWTMMTFCSLLPHWLLALSVTKLPRLDHMQGGCSMWVCFHSGGDSRLFEVEFMCQLRSASGGF